MQIIEIAPKFQYSCQLCQSGITSNKELKIIEFESPYCSNSCLYKFCFQLAKIYFPNKDKKFLFTWTEKLAGVLK